MVAGLALVNTGPAVWAIADRTMVDGATVTVTDADTSQTHTVVAESSDAAVVGVSVSEEELTLTAESVGGADVRVTAGDGSGASNATSTPVTFRVTVVSSNSRPVVAAIADVEVGNGSTAVRDVTVMDADASDTHTVTAVSGNTSVATVSVTGKRVTVRGVGGGTATVTVRATDDSGASNATSAARTFTVTVSNTRPVVASIANRTVSNGSTSAVDVTVTDADAGDAHTVTAASGDTSVAPVTVSGKRVTVRGRGCGTATVTVHATDDSGAWNATSAARTFTVTVPNDRPVVGPITGIEVANGSTATRDVTVTDDACGGVAHTLMAVSSDTSVATVTVTGNRITVRGVGRGTATITVKATDASGASNATSALATFLLGIARRCFETVADPVARRGGASLADCLMSGLAVYGLKYASLLKFDEAARGDDAVRSNLRRLYGVSRVPSDTRMRERLDEVDPESLRSCYRRLFAALQPGKGLEGFACLDGHYLLSVDGTGHHSSKKVHCPNCCEKHHRDGTTTYYHMMLGAVLVHPEEREVFPLAPEPIAKTDGSKKNDCERNAAKRLLGDVRREHPHLKLVVVEDALASNGPHIELLRKLDMRFVLGAKPGDHAFLFEWVDNTPGTRTAEFAGEDGVRHRFRWLNGAPLNDANFDLEVNFLEYREISAQGRERRFSWVTDLPVGEDNLMELMRAGRARWRIENETFNTLKNQGYAFGHNFGHGDKHLSTVLAHLMMLAFLIDQIQQRCCAVFRRARARAKRPKYLWEQVRAAFLLVAVPDWETPYALATKDRVAAVAVVDTS